MVIKFRCLSFGNVAQETESYDEYVTAPSRFDQRPSGSTPTSRNVDYIRSGVPHLNGGPTNLRVFTLDELNEATKNFSTKIGEGGFGSVHVGMIDNVHVAVKRGKRGLKGQRQWQTEVDFLGIIEHKNLVKLIGYCFEEDGNESNWLLVYEYMANKSVDDHLSGKSENHLDWPTRLKIARDAATGLKYLHEGMGINKKVIFRDFKPSNVLLDEAWNAKLSDFGLVREAPQDGRSHVSTLVVGTKGYAAPEYVQTGRLTIKGDVWSYGIFLEDLIAGQRAITQKNSEIDSKCLKWVFCYAGQEKSKLVVDPRLQDKYSVRSMEKISSIAAKCLVKNPKLRPTMNQVLEKVNQAIELENQQPL